MTFACNQVEKCNLVLFQQQKTCLELIQGKQCLLKTTALVWTISAIYPISDKVFMLMWVALNRINLLESTVNFVPLPKTSFPAPPVFTQCHTTHQNPLSHATQICIHS